MILFINCSLTSSCEDPESPDFKILATELENLGEGSIKPRFHFKVFETMIQLGKFDTSRPLI